ncbi:MAG: peptidylprolyl isomerase [Bacteroidota bacterium]
MEQRKKNLLLVFGIISLLLFISCTDSSKNHELALFDDGRVLYNEYLEHFLLSAKYKPDKFPTVENLKEIVELKAIEKMAVQEALVEGIDKDSAYISIVNNNERRLLYQKYVNSKFTNSIITDSLLQKFYNEYTPQYNMKYIMRPIVKTSTPKFIEKQKNKIWEAYKELKEGVEFGKVAEKYSQDKTTNKKGGDLGWIILESMGDHVVRTVMDTLSEHSYSIPFRGFGGYYILYKGDHREVKVPPYKDIKQRIWKSLYHSRRAYIQEALDKQFLELSKKHHYKLNDKAIDKALKKAGFNSDVSKYTDLNFGKLTNKDKLMKIAEYDGGYIPLGDLFANSKKAPINKFEFTKRLENLSEIHLISVYAKEINLQDIDELPEQIESMKTSLLRAILFQRKVGDKVDEMLRELKAEKDPGKRNEIKTELRTEYENYLKTKYNFSFKEENFTDALDLATDAKKEQNLERSKSE